eukprot:Anaeramoba_flamelloidesa136459_13.p1 GENE.a136459_13~~a136459_13.p1  ORF type:complete len:126 (-),score=4.60 a136459_13:317-694(-)
MNISFFSLFFSTFSATHAAHLHGVGQPGVDMVVQGKRMHLSLAPQATEGAGKDNTIMILVEVAAPDLVGRQRLMSVAVGGKELVPVHHVLTSINSPPPHTPALKGTGAANGYQQLAPPVAVCSPF